MNNFEGTIIVLNPPIIKGTNTYFFCQILSVNVNLGYNAIIWAMLLPTIENWTIYEDIHYTMTPAEYSNWKDNDNYILDIVKRIIYKK